MVRAVIIDAEKPKAIQKDPQMIIYYPQKSESLWGIAKKYDSQVSKIMKFNKCENHNIVDKKIIIFAAKREITACITASGITDIYYIHQKHHKNRELSKKALLNLIPIIDILDVNASDCEKALSLSMSDFEDALQVACAKRQKVDYIVTRNLKDFNNSPVNVISPDDFLILIDSKRKP